MYLGSELKKNFHHYLTQQPPYLFDVWALEVVVLYFEILNMLMQFSYWDVLLHHHLSAYFYLVRSCHVSPLDLLTFLPDIWSKSCTSLVIPYPCISCIASSFYGSLRCSFLCNNSCRTCIERKFDFDGEIKVFNIKICF
jgi:hypothetical protein